jgi:hypothetical protein
MRPGILFAAALWTGVIAAQAADRTPILVELFTSEGCSSCPPADRLLQQLDAQTIVLSEHVDYWDHDGWKDPHSSHELTLRQEDYATRFGIEGPYTPQMVIDGVAEFNGSDVSRAKAELAKSAGRPHATIRLSRQDGAIAVHVEGAPASANVMLALADNFDASDVRAGENKGRRMEHVAVVRSLRKVGSVKRGGGFDETVKLPAGAAAERAIVFLQQGSAGPVEGAAELGPN